MQNHAIRRASKSVKFRLSIKWLSKTFVIFIAFTYVNYTNLYMEEYTIKH